MEGTDAMKSLQPIAHDESPSVDQSTWSSSTERRIGIQLVRAKAYVNERCNRPLELYPHCSSLLTLMEQAHRYAGLKAPLLDLMVDLGDWPTRWGFWYAWEQILRFGLRTTQTRDDVKWHNSLLNEMAQLLMLSGRIDQALEFQLQAFVAAITAGDIDLAISVAELLIHIFTRKGTADATDRCLVDIEGHPLLCNASNEAKGRLFAIKAKVYRRRGDLISALAYINEAIAYLEKAALRDPQTLADAYDQRGIIYWALGDYPSAESDLSHTAEVYSSVCNPYAHARVFGSLGIVYWCQGKLDEAESTINNAIRIKREHNENQTMSMEVGNLGLVSLSRGNLSRAALYIRRHLSLAQKSGDTLEEMRAVSNMSAVFLHQRKYREALPGLQADETFQKSNDNSEALVCDYIWHAGCLAGMGQHDEALEFARRANKMAEESGSTALRVIALRCLAKHNPQSLQESILRQALELAIQSHRQLDEAACLLSLATLQHEPDQKELWGRGKALLKRIGAAAWLRGRSIINPPDIVMIA